MPFTSNIDEIITALSKVPEEVNMRVGEVVAKIVFMFDEKIHPYTPVWSGRAVRNMIWSMDVPNEADIDPIASGPEGEATRRAPNVAAARQSLNTLDFKNPNHIYYLSNAAFHIEELEAGKLSTRIPPGGMFRTTYAEVVAQLRSM